MIVFSNIEVRSSNQGWSVVAMQTWIVLLLQETFTGDYYYYSQSNLTLKSLQNINNYVKYQFAGSLTRNLTILILLKQSIEILTLVLPTVSINPHCKSPKWPCGCVDFVCIWMCRSSPSCVYLCFQEQHTSFCRGSKWAGSIQMTNYVHGDITYDTNTF